MAKEKVTPVKGGKSGKTRERRSFWSRALQAPKVRSALEYLEVSEDAFEKAYLATRKTRESADFTDADKQAFVAYMEHRDIDKLAVALDCSKLTAAVKLGKAMEQRIV